MLQRCMRPSVRISCVINNYNYEKYIGQAIESALAQTAPFEKIVVVDDGSTDNSRQVIERFAPHITPIFKRNSGQTASCIAGLRECHSEFVHFLDADDYLKSDFVQYIGEYCAANDAAVKVQFQLTTVDDDGNTYGNFPTFPIDYSTRDMQFDNGWLGFYCSPCTTGNVFRRSTLIAQKLEVLNGRAAIDGTLNFIQPYLGAIVSINQPLAFRRIHGNSWTQTSDPTPDRLYNEIRELQQVWGEALLLLDNSIARPENAVLVLERELMSRALGGEMDTLPAAVKFMKRLAQGQSITRETLLRCLWALSLCIPMQNWRDYAVRARRSPRNRGARIDRLLRKFAQK